MVQEKTGCWDSRLLLRPSQEGEGLCMNPHHPGAGPLVMQVPDHVGLG